MRPGPDGPEPGALHPALFPRRICRAHVKDKRCPAGVCKALLNYKIDPDKCKGCTALRPHLPGRRHHRHRASSRMSSIPAKCIKCGACMEKCKFGAIIKRLREGVCNRMETVQYQNQRHAPIESPPALPFWRPPASAGIEIPTLCYLKEINEIGACRICVVEVKGARSLVAACVYPVNEGMEIVHQHRKGAWRPARRPWS